MANLRFEWLAILSLTALHMYTSCVCAEKLLIFLVMSVVTEDDEKLNFFEKLSSLAS